MYGGLVPVMTTILDLFILKLMQLEELEKKSAYVRAVLDSVVDSVITMTAEGIIEHLNATALNTFGYSYTDAVGKYGIAGLCVARLISNKCCEQLFLALSKKKAGAETLCGALACMLWADSCTCVIGDLACVGTIYCAGKDTLRIHQRAVLLCLREHTSCTWRTVCVPLRIHFKR